MRRIELSDGNGRLRDDAHVLLTALAYFHDDEPAYKQAVFLWHTENDRMLIEGEAFRPSSLVRDLVTLTERKQAAMMLAGYVAIVLSVLGAFGHRMSLRRAAGIVSEHVYSTDGKAVWRNPYDPPDTFRSRPATGDLDSIERHFRAYRPVAHILAARASAAEHLVPLGITERAPEAEKCFVRTAIDFEARLSRAPNFASWNVWSLCFSTPPEIFDYPPLLPGPEFLTAIFGEEGLLKIMPPVADTGAIESPQG